MRRVLGIACAVELAPVPGVNEQLDRTAQGLNTARETPGATGQTRQVVPQLRIYTFHPIRLCFFGHGGVEVVVNWQVMLG